MITANNVQRHGVIRVAVTSKRRFSALRRATAVIVAFALTLGVAEAAIPDAHDSDAGYATAAVEQQPTGGIGGAEMAPRGGAVPPTAPSKHDAPSHPVHVDHCTHAHVAAAAGSAKVTEAAPAAALPRVINDRALKSVVRSPLMRPPIA